MNANSISTEARTCITQGKDRMHQELEILAFVRMTRMVVSAITLPKEVLGA